jgi:hypothetical protein
MVAGPSERGEGSHICFKAAIRARTARSPVLTIPHGIHNAIAMDRGVPGTLATDRHTSVRSSWPCPRFPPPAGTGSLLDVGPCAPRRSGIPPFLLSVRRAGVSGYPQRRRGRSLAHPPDLFPRLPGNLVHPGARSPFAPRPDRGGTSEARKFREQYAQTLATYEEWFGPPPEAFWPSTQKRFVAKPRCRTIDTERVIAIARLRLPDRLSGASGSTPPKRPILPAARTGHSRRRCWKRWRRVMFGSIQRGLFWFIPPAKWAERSPSI